MKHLTEHLFKKQGNGWVCETCGLTWKRKPKKLKCEGIPAIKYDEKPEKSIWDFNLRANNLTARNAEPIAYHHKPSGRHDYCYKLADCQKWRENVPGLILSKRRKDELGYKTKSQLEKMHLKPIDNARKCAVYYWNREEGDNFAVFYHLDDTEFCAIDQFLTKSTLKKVYLLPDSWIKEIGAPDKITENPHHKSFAPMHLYSKQRVEKFLADNAEKYSIWLDKRDQYLKIFEANKEKIFRNRNLIKEQTKQCVQCASSATIKNGVFCAIYPLGLPVDKMPCKDFKKRAAMDC